MIQVQTEWDLSQERVFMENLFCQRFNFFIVIFSLVIAGAASANTQPKLDAILWVGFALCTLVALTLYRNYVKLIWVLKSLHQIPQHPVAQGGEYARHLGLRSLFGVQAIIGIIIPLICCSVLLVGAILASFCLLAAK
jgi:hypothetical protein